MLRGSVKLRDWNKQVQNNFFCKLSPFTVHSLRVQITNINQILLELDPKSTSKMIKGIFNF